MVPIGAQRGTKAGHGVSFGPMRKKLEKWGPSRVSKTGVGGTGTTLWGFGKTSHSEKSIAKTLGKRHFGKLAKTGAVRKGELLRGKVSQGRPHPLRHGVKE